MSVVEKCHRTVVLRKQLLPIGSDERHYLNTTGIHPDGVPMRRSRVIENSSIHVATHPWYFTKKIEVTLSAVWTRSQNGSCVQIVRTDQFLVLYLWRSHVFAVLPSGLQHDEVHIVLAVLVNPIRRA